MNNIPQYYCFYCVLDQTIGEHERLKKALTNPKLLNGIVCQMF